jgi:hypothetical protein
MSFLDNSGDIILDAVLTDLGRKRMSTGNFRITKFALGDDEINYNLYDKNHPSGSAYYDLEILQTPVLESITGIAAHINYGLLSISNTNLLYLPTIKTNELVPNSARRRDNVYYLAIRDGKTPPALVSAFGGVQGGGNTQVLRSGQRNGTKIILETGLDTDEIPGTPTNRTNFIAANNLGDNSFSVSCDARFITAVLGPTNNSIFNNTAGSGDSNTRFNLNGNPLSANNRAMRNHQIATVRAINNAVIKRQNDNKADTETSVIKGPRASVTALNFVVKLLSAEDYRRYGKVNQTISGANGTYRYIDTNVKVMTGIGDTFQLPIRIIEKE